MAVGVVAVVDCEVESVMKEDIGGRIMTRNNGSN